jgi:hypothetical protein
MDIHGFLTSPKVLTASNNPFTPEKFATLARRCVWKRGPSA